MIGTLYSAATTADRVTELVAEPRNPTGEPRHERSASDDVPARPPSSSVVCRPAACFLLRPVRDSSASSRTSSGSSVLNAVSCVRWSVYALSSRVPRATNRLAEQAFLLVQRLEIDFPLDIDIDAILERLLQLGPER